MTGSQPLPHNRVSNAPDGRRGRSVSIDRAAELLGVSRRTVYNHIRGGKLETIRTLGGSQRVLLASVDQTLGGQAACRGDHAIPLTASVSGS